MIRITPTLILVFGLWHGAAWAQTDGSDPLPTDAPGIVQLLPNSLTQLDGALKDFNQPVKRTFALELGPKLIELKGFYLEAREEDKAQAGLLEAPGAAQSGGYFDLFAVSSRFGGKLIGESELAYSALGLSDLPEQQPVMTRLGLRGRWGKAGYGLSYRSFGSGFVSTGGVKVEHARDENQLWAEYDLGLFRLRGAAGEAEETNSATHQITLTRTAVTSLAWNRPKWNALLSSSYSVIGQEPALNQKTFAWSNGLAIAFRPTTSLTLEPNLGFKQEWDRSTGLKTDTTSATLALSCTPSRDFQLIGRASFANGMGDDPLKHASTLDTGARLNWNLGKTFLGEQSLSLQFDYKNDFRPNIPDNAEANFTGMIQFRIAGF